jgi:hypothetical protein
MFTIRKHTGIRIPTTLLNMIRGAALLVAFAMTSTPFAQCGIEENGYLFLHPYFQGTAWNATSFVSNILPDVDMCLDKPVNAAAGKLMEQGTFVYTTADGTMWISAGPLADNDCPCCRPSILFEESPIEITLPDGIDLQPELPFCLPGRGGAEADTAYLVAAGSDQRVYCLHISTGTGATGAVDTIELPGLGTSELTGVWGEAQADESDTAVWIGGSDGFFVRVPISSNRWGTPVALTVDASETVTAVGGGYVGMLSGALYRRTGDVLTATGVSADGALRYVTGRVAVGDGGSVLTNRNGTWQAQTSGSTDFRLGNLTANDTGAVVELVDAAWRYSVLQLSDSPTSIDSVSPEAAGGLNDSTYLFDTNGISSIGVLLRDRDGNRSIPLIKLKHGSTVTTLDKGDDGTVLQPQTPTALSSSPLAYFNDTLIRLALKPDSVVVEAEARRGGNFDASCLFYKWDYITYTRKLSWGLNDSLLVHIGSDTLRIVNKAEATVTTIENAMSAKSRGKTILTCTGRSIRLIPGDASDIRRVTLVDAAGRCVWKYAGRLPSGAVLASPRIPQGIHFLRIEYGSGKVESRRMVLVGR